MAKVTLVALAAVMLMAGPAFATGKPGHGGHGHGRHGHGGQRLHSSLPTRVFPHHHQRFHGHKFHGHGKGFGVVVAPPVVGYGGFGYVPPTYAVPEYVTPPPAYAPPSVSYAPPPSYAPPQRTVVEFSSGRYVLQGDGLTAPYRWVWVPNPPPAPPVEEPSAPPPPPPAPTSTPEPTRSLDFYRWTDSEGVTHFSDRLERVPEAYRSKVTKSRT